MTECLHIVIAMKPVEAGFAENALKHGVAGLNIEEGRIAGGWTRKATPGVTPYGSDKTWHGRVEGVHSTTEDMDRGAEGRWPANVILGHAEGCVLKGTKKVKPNEGNRVNPVGKQSDGKIQFSLKPEGYRKVSYTDDDGMEKTEDWKCVEGCPMLAFPETRARGNITPTKRRHSNASWAANGPAIGIGLDGPIDAGDAGSAARFFKQIAEVQVDE